ncbi:DUF2141 domain-containing protein [Algoriphagus sp.]|uniref:DUF2141 domain-containing protein n=1 Tax=Algoriphagus sp. TaxID=1872435 RepID=UPI003919A8C6
MTSQNSGEIDLHIHEAKSNKGVVRILVFDSEKGYPDKPDLALKSFSAPVVDRKCFFKITDLKPGKYSIAVFHDEDENGKINTNPFGYPLEKYGFSNNAKGYFGPPEYAKTIFELKDERKEILINLR